MLLFLTGDIQIGKTRWLMSQVEALEAGGVQACGVIAPGVWKPTDSGFDKLGIDNLLLPERRTVPFARRRDLAEAAGSYDGRSQSARADLLWAIDDEAIDEVNAHLQNLAGVDGPGRRLLVIDELGRLELLHGGGLVAAMGLLDRGATPAFPHALVIVRAQLLDFAHERLAAAPWDGMRDISPNDDAASLLQRLFERDEP